MTDPHSGWIDPNPPDPIDPRAPVVLAVAGAVLTLIVVATLIGVVLFATAGSDGQDAGEALLIGANAPAENPFARSIVVAPVAIPNQVAMSSAELIAQIPVRADRGVRPVSGRQPGLFGTTGATPPCDIVTLANDLDADPAAARVWGLALGITAQQIPYYLNTLTPVVLMADTWVTTHAFAEGAASPKQAVLQAGNAVLIDPLGVPRVRCASSAPLVPPDHYTLTRFRLVGQEWPGFAVPTVIAVKYGATDGGPASEFTLIDITTGQYVTSPAGGAIDLGGASVPLPDPAVMNVAPDRPRTGDR